MSNRRKTVRSRINVKAWVKGYSRAPMSVDALMDFIDETRRVSASVQADLSDGKQVSASQINKALDYWNITGLEMFRTMYMLMSFFNQEGATRRWSDEETEKAVNWRAEGRTLEWIALSLNRTTQSVATRITNAVGIRQLEVSINGVINGDLSGEHAEGMFTGTLRKERKP